ncbi:PhzF family phenazine biosynthesis protein [Paenibacillus sp. FSL W7-1287]|uniref:PhzF family phenazine biosynthesis protein n=1 Tax=Paenibacillus sp. FSL W7-1287 TaxID=2954538 RepID=UPI0030F744C4
MNSIQVLHYDAFSTEKNKGNPAGVVIDSPQLTEADMQRIAKKVGFNETVFVLSSQVADVRLRYYTPGHEINLCGHATIASLYCLKTKGLIEANTITIETNVGVLPVTFDTIEDQLVITMKQDEPQFQAFQGDVDKLAASLGLSLEEIDLAKPIVYGSTGTWTLLVPIKRLSSFPRMKPDNQRFPEILIENSKASVHPLCFETIDKAAMMHARHFSSPYSGTIEDAVTGTASGVMGAYYLTYMDTQSRSLQCVVEQGQEIGRDGRVFVKAIRNDQPSIDVYISGTAAYVGQITID